MVTFEWIIIVIALSLVTIAILDLVRFFNSKKDPYNSIKGKKRQSNISSKASHVEMPEVKPSINIDDVHATNIQSESIEIKNTGSDKLDKLRNLKK